MKRPPLVNNSIYHVYNRGADKRDIFRDDKDRLRFLHSLFEFNDEKQSSNLNYYMGNGLDALKRQKRERKLLVEILAFALMPNHFHLLLRQKVDGGISKFMQKLGTGYTLYFNEKQNRSGVLFQGKYKAVLVDNESYFMFLPHYIHFNPLALPNYGGRTSIVWEKHVAFLKTYRWSSFLDYIGIRNFPSITQRDFLLDYFGGEKAYEQRVIEWLQAEEGENKRVLGENKFVLIDDIDEAVAS